jgi:predicted alpha/beta-fold hydrolase
VQNDYLNFKPLIKSSYYQTLIGSAIDFELDLASKRHRIQLPDNDFLSVEVSTPSDWVSSKWTVLMVHGLCGSHKSHYMKRIARRLYKSGVQVVRVNLRGCGSGRGLAKGIYHSGSSHDIFEVVKYVKEAFPLSPKLLIGFSLGANISLKLSGELGSDGRDYLKGVIAVSPPADLLSSARLFTLPENQFYANYFIKLLVNEVNFRHKHFDLPPHNLPKNVTLTEFDEIYTAPIAKFSSAFEYYYYSSSKRVIPKILVPTRILFANDDPIIKSTVLDNIALPSHIKVYKTEHGGHIGFVGLNIFKEFRWMDKIVIDWVNEMTCGRSV